MRLPCTYRRWVVFAALVPGYATQAQPLGEPVYCFAAGTTQDEIDAFYASRGPAAQPQFFADTRWSGTRGTPRTLTWSLVPDGVVVEGQTSRLFSTMDARFESRGGRQVWIQQIESALNRWGALGGTSYTRIKSGSNDWDDGAAYGSSGSGTRGDIRIFMIPLDGQNRVLAFNHYPPNGDMVMDADEDWGRPLNNFRFLRNVVAHEHGHGLGFAHVCPMAGTKLMEPFLDTSFDGPQHDDIRALQYMYGDKFEDNNTMVAAKFIGPLVMGTSTDFGAMPSPSVPNGAVLSIDAANEADYFRFSVPDAGAISLTLVPVGLSYDSSPQVSQTECGSGSFINSLNMANLNLQLIAGDGITVLATAAAQAAGASETLVDAPLGAAGDYYLRVYHSGGLSGPQLYHLQITTKEVDCNHNGIPDVMDLVSGASQDCNGNGRPDECEPAGDGNGDQLLDACQWARGDFDLDGDADMADYGFLQACRSGNDVPVPGDCAKAVLDTDGDVDAADVNIFKLCLSGDRVELDWECR